MRIAYVGMFEFPEGDAGAARVLGVGRALHECGHSVIFLGIEKTALFQTGQEVLGGGCASIYQEFACRSPEPAGTNIRGKLKRQFLILTGSSVLTRLRAEESEAGSIDAVIAYQSPSLSILRLLSWCRSKRIPFICDTVEWYDTSHVWGGRYGIMALDSELRMRKIQALSDGIIAISRYLENYYSSRIPGLPILRLPPLIDILADKWLAQAVVPARKPIRLAFVGNAGRKDLLVNAIRGLSLLGEEAARYEIVMIGPSQREIRRNLGEDSYLLERLAGSLHFAGRLPHREALQHLAGADYSILLRPDARFAHAGFPTKLVESLGMGVPVICNLTGDIGLYVHDGYEGIVVKDSSPDAFAEGLRHMLQMSPGQKAAMRKHARKRAELSFDYRNWMQPLGEFIDMVITNHRQMNTK